MNRRKNINRQNERIERYQRARASLAEQRDPASRAEFQISPSMKIGLGVVTLGYVLAFTFAVGGWNDLVPDTPWVAWAIGMLSVGIPASIALMAGSHGGIPFAFPGIPANLIRSIACVAVVLSAVGVGVFMFTLFRESYAPVSAEKLKLDQLRSHQAQLVEDRAQLWNELDKLGNNYFAAKMKHKEERIDPLDRKIDMIRQKVEAMEHSLLEQTERGGLKGFAGLAEKLHIPHMGLCAALAIVIALLLDPALFAMFQVLTLSIYRQRLAFDLLRDQDEIVHPELREPEQTLTLALPEFGTPQRINNNKKKRWFRR